MKEIIFAIKYCEWIQKQQTPQEVNEKGNAQVNNHSQNIHRHVNNNRLIGNVNIGIFRGNGGNRNRNKLYTNKLVISWMII